MCVIMVHILCKTLCVLVWWLGAPPLETGCLGLNPSWATQ